MKDLQSDRNHHCYMVGRVLSVILPGDGLVFSECICTFAEDVVSFLSYLAEVCIRVEAVICACGSIKTSGVICEII